MKKMTLSDIQDVSLDIMKQVHEFCVSNDIKYSLAYGTLIGAIRHKGFIPWDDDADIIMPRPDYERFCQTFKAPGYELASRSVRDDCLISFARVCDTVRTEIHTMVPWIRNKGNLGVWIDIFPIDAASDDYDSFSRDYLAIHSNHKKCIKARKALRPFTCDKSFKYNFNTLKKKLISPFKRKPEYYLEQNKGYLTFPYGSTNHVTQIAYPDKEEYIDASIMDRLILTPYEDTEFYIVEKYDELLKLEYGDYMKLPPKEERVPQQSYISFFWKD